MECGGVGRASDWDAPAMLLALPLLSSFAEGREIPSWPVVQGSCSNPSHKADSTFYAFLEKDGWDVDNAHALPNNYPSHTEQRGRGPRALTHRWYSTVTPTGTH